MEQKRRKDFITTDPDTKFGRWTYLGEEIYKKHQRGAHHLMHCECECGTRKWVRRQSLVNGTSRSCGCLKAEIARHQMAGQQPANTLPPGHASRNKVVYSYKRNAQLRGISWGLSNKTCYTLFESPCYYCGDSHAQCILNTPGSTPFYYNGIDRVDNTLGYVDGNVVPCCEMCNKAKNKHSLTKFLGWIKRVYEKSCYERAHPSLEHHPEI
jgi:hypothetical protein